MSCRGWFGRGGLEPDFVEKRQNAGGSAAQAVEKESWATAA